MATLRERTVRPTGVLVLIGVALAVAAAVNYQQGAYGPATAAGVGALVAFCFRFVG
jgi:hypothetical protein